MEKSDTSEVMLIEPSLNTIDIAEFQSNELLDSPPPSRSASPIWKYNGTIGQVKSDSNAFKAKNIQLTAVRGDEMERDVMVMSHDIDDEQSDQNSAKMKNEIDVPKRHSDRASSNKSQPKRKRMAHPSNDSVGHCSYQKNYIHVKGETVFLEIG